MLTTLNVIVNCIKLCTYQGYQKTWNNLEFEKLKKTPTFLTKITKKTAILNNFYMLSSTI